MCDCYDAEFVASWGGQQVGGDFQRWCLRYSLWIRVWWSMALIWSWCVCWFLFKCCVWFWDFLVLEFCGF